MKVNTVYKIYRPMRRFGNLIKDIFFPSKSTHWWMRLPECLETEQEKKDLLKAIQKHVKQRVQVYESN
jgi:hypothetical protein